MSALAALLAFALAFATAGVLVRRFRFPLPHQRYVAIAGLRGYLAFGVFLHHAAAWFELLHAQVWRPPASRLYAHFGESTVGLFFMITGFLFFSKLIDARTRGIDWLQIYVSRVLRLTPMYLAAVAVLLVIVAAQSQFVLRVPIGDLVHQLFAWLTFTVIGEPDINGVVDTRVIIAGVTWTLAYEWFFYAILPALLLTLGRFPGVAPLGLSVAAIAAAIWQSAEIAHLTMFLGGIAVAILSRSAQAARWLAGRGGSALAVVSLVSLVVFFDGALSPGAIVLLTLTFAAIACGNTLFGLLARPESLLLGEVSYSIYLIHGLLLYVAFELVLGRGVAANFTMLQHTTLALALAPVLVLLSSLTFLTIEAPAMRRVSRTTRWLRGQALAVWTRHRDPGLG